MDAAKASHPPCVERHLQDWGRDELFRRSYARLPKPLHESAGAKLNRRIGYHVSTRNKPACTLCVEVSAALEYHHSRGNLLHSAVSRGSTAAMRLLVDQGLDLTSTVALTGETAVHLAARAGQSGAIAWLLGHGGRLDVRDGDGMEPPVSAILKRVRCPLYWNAREVLKTIAESASGSNSLQTVFRGKSLIHLASLRGFSACAELLLSKGAGVDSKTVDASEEAALHCAARHNHMDVVEVLANAGATTDIRDSVGMTPLLVASRNAHLEMVVLLLELGASSAAADEAGNTPLGAAAGAGSVACCSLLVASGADMAHRDNHGRAALGVASESHRSDRTEVEEG